MSKKGIMLGYVVFIILAIFLYFFLQTTSPEVALTNQELELKTFVIEKGEGLKEIGQKLKDQGFIKNSKLFEFYAFLSQARNKFWPGEYHLNTGINLKELVKTLISEPLAREKTVTLIEGWTNKETGVFLEKEELAIQDDFFTALDEISRAEEILNKYEFLPEAVEKSFIEDSQAKLQGYLFPDTYRFYEQTTAQAIIKKMLENFDQKLDSQLRTKIKESGRTIFEMITLASLIEKEAALDQDRRLIADIFWKRLNADWALESCATINYILGTAKPRLSFEDTRIPSPYNTYLNSGLPPGPINNPGLSAIRAAIEPLENDYCCFLSTDEGKVIFSQTIEEHNRNKAIYFE
ncbi:endolytic transglycosylase MltG [Patescibacteria group bacterium]|nr:endolytic transglycosylase MltG [Patescibacteria group bacterium]